MARDKLPGPNTPDKMLQIQNRQKALLSESIFDGPGSPQESPESTIHSGHFMVSRVHEDKDDDDDDEVTNFSDDTKDFSVAMGYDFVQANRATSQTYNFGPKSTQTLSIDASLTKLFECMTLAYSGKITSPKWKPFRGMHLTVKDKVRLNNIIWREWHMQYIFMQRSVVCQFATPLSDYIHTKPEAVVLEGKYWKRRLDTVTKEYKKWRRYYRDRILQTMPETPSLFPYSREQHLSEVELLERVKDVSVMPRNVLQSSTDLTLLNADLMDMDFSDNLFSSLSQPFAFPNPRDIGQLTCADLIQPGLVQLQPNLEDFMDIDTMQDMLGMSRQYSSSFSSAFTSSFAPSFTPSFTPSSESSSGLSDLHTAMDMAQPQVQSTMAQSVLGLLDPSIFNSGSNTAGISMLTALAALTSSNNTNNNNTNSGLGIPAATTPAASTFFLPDAQMIVDDSSSSASKQTFSATRQQVGFGGTPFSSASPPLKSVTQSAPAFLRGGLNQQQTVNTDGLNLTHIPGLSLSPLPVSQNRSPAPSQAASTSKTSPGQTGSARNSQQQAKTVKGQISAKVNSRTASPSNSPLSSRGGSGQTGSSGKRDGFVVPQGKPAAAQRKPRPIAPAPSPPRTTAAVSTPTPSMQSTYLAQLLREGTYHRAGINIKEEPTPVPVVSIAKNTTKPISSPQLFTPILPAVPASNPQRLAPALSSSPSPISPSVTVTAVSPGVAKLPSDFTVEFTKVAGVDFPTSVLIAAASSALGTTSASLKDVLRLNPSNTATACIPSATEMMTTSVSSPKPRSPMPMSMSPSPIPPATPPPSSPLAAAFSESLSPVPSPSSLSVSSFQSSPPSFNKEATAELGFRLGVHTEQRRVAHLSAEQKRRCNLKSGFDLLHTLVPALAQNPKVSKATMLQKTAEHCRKMKTERAQMQREAAILKQEIESLNNSISVVQSQLPETGVPVTRQRVDQMKEMFEEYVRSRTLQNWKFWIFSIIIRPLFDSYNNMVSTTNVEELCRTTIAWLDQHCSLVSLRPTVLNALRHLSMTTSILTEPQRVREQATQAVTKGGDGKGGKLGDTTGHS
ncbi:MLX-interacting protein-like isoform X2 [Littorina saxatilis]